jgi:hypothetical protein
MKYYTPRHFAVWEFVPMSLYKEKGDDALLVMDRRILETADQIREFFGVPVVINNWHECGERNESGFRFSQTSTGADYSQHKFGRAIDCLVGKLDAETVRRQILRNPRAFPHITVIEDGVDWLHADCRCVDSDSIVLIKP